MNQKAYIYTVYTVDIRMYLIKISELCSAISDIQMMLMHVYKTLHELTHLYVSTLLLTYNLHMFTYISE